MLQVVSPTWSAAAAAEARMQYLAGARIAFDAQEVTIKPDFVRHVFESNKENVEDLLRMEEWLGKEALVETSDKQRGEIRLRQAVISAQLDYLARIGQM